MIRVVCSVLIYQKNKVLLVSETKVNKYGLPGGKLEVGETLRECAIRETQEEIGATIKINNLVMVTQKPKTHNGNNVVRYIYRGSILEYHTTQPELAYRYYNREEIAKLKSQDMIRGKDVSVLLDSYLKDSLHPITEPTLFD
jgi:ADP-ribose pyrophosphatase YjhB (NUDIX family)